MTLPIEHSANLTNLRVMVTMDDNNCLETTAAYILTTNQVMDFINMFGPEWIAIPLHDMTDIDYKDGN